jgi:hypothetical protein
MMQKRYALHAGFVTSQTDGQKHFIDPQKLAKLYGVTWGECVVIRQDTLTRFRHPELVQLHPRDDGDYQLPDVRKTVSSTECA